MTGIINIVLSEMHREAGMKAGMNSVLEIGIQNFNLNAGISI
jgi:hypothetical protein